MLLFDEMNSSVLPQQILQCKGYNHDILNTTVLPEKGLTK